MRPFRGTSAGAGSRARRIGVAAVAMVVVAEGAVWVLRPGEAPIESAAVAETDVLPPAELDRAESFRRGQLALFGGGLAAQAALLVAFSLGRPAAARRALHGLDRRPVAGAAAAGAGLAVGLAIVAAPTGIWAHERAADVGLSTQPLGGWALDLGLSTAITAAFAAGGAAGFVALARRFPRNWWLPGAAAVAALAAVFAWLAPVVLAPLFNRFEPLPQDSVLRERVLRLGERADVEIGEVYRVDASRRSTALNAYVGGLGPTKRVVLYDTLIDRERRDQLESVVAHELAHVDHADIPRGLAFVALVAPLGLLFVRELGGAIAARGGGGDAPAPGNLPAYALAAGVAAFVLSVPGNQLSRQVEASADRFALELTRDPGALVELQRSLARTNLSDPDPPGAVTFLLGTHPPAVDRIGAARAWAEERQIELSGETTRR